MLKKISDNRGLVKTIIMIVIALLILSYFGLNLRNIATSDTGKDNFTYVKEVILNVWNKYLKKPAQYLWYDVFLKLIWGPAIENLNKLKNGEAHDIQTSAPRLAAPGQ